MRHNNTWSFLSVLLCVHHASLKEAASNTGDSTFGTTTSSAILVPSCCPVSSAENLGNQWAECWDTWKEFIWMSGNLVARFQVVTESSTKEPNLLSTPSLTQKNKLKTIIFLWSVKWAYRVPPFMYPIFRRKSFSFSDSEIMTIHPSMCFYSGVHLFWRMQNILHFLAFVVFSC